MFAPALDSFALWSYVSNVGTAMGRSRGEIEGDADYRIVTGTRYKKPARPISHNLKD